MADLLRILQHILDTEKVIYLRPNAHVTISGNSVPPERATVRSDSLFHDDVGHAARSAAPTSSHSQGRTALACRQQGTCAESDSASPQSACSPRPARRRRSHRRRRDAGAQERARALHPPRRRTPRCVWLPALLQTAALSIGAHLRRRTSHVPRTVGRQRPVSTPGVAALVRQPVSTNDHRGRDVSCLEEPAPLRDPLTVTGEDDCLGRIWWDVHRNLPTTVVGERLAHKLSSEWSVIHYGGFLFGDAFLGAHASMLYPLRKSV